jgi:hypothetical protein
MRKFGRSNRYGAVVPRSIGAKVRMHVPEATMKEPAATDVRAATGF